MEATGRVILLPALGIAYLFLPLLGGGVFHGLCMKYEWLSFLKRPIDRGHTVRGRPLFGANKTFRELRLVTVKPMSFATRILERFDLAARFVSVHAPDLADRDVRKASLIREALGASQGDPAAVTMVGDRAEDIDGARRNGVRSVAVTWGYGSRAELEAAGANHLVSSVVDLLGVMGAA